MYLLINLKISLLKVLISEKKNPTDPNVFEIVSLNIISSLIQIQFSSNINA